MGAGGKVGKMTRRCTFQSSQTEMMRPDCGNQISELSRRSADTHVLYPTREVLSVEFVNLLSNIHTCDRSPIYVGSKQEQNSESVVSDMDPPP